MVVMPRLSSQIARNNITELSTLIQKCLHITVLISMPIMVGIIAVADNLVPWFFGPGYEKVVDLLFIFAPLSVIMGLSNILGNQYLVAARKERILAIIMFIGLLLNFGLNFIFVPVLASVGASIATVVTEFFKLLIILWVSKNIICGSAFSLDVLKYFGYSVCMAIVVIWMKENFWSQPSVIHTLSLSLLGFGTYFFILLIRRESFLLSLGGRIFNRSK